MDNRDDLRKSPRTPEEILATGAAWISELELDYIIKRLATAESELEEIKSRYAEDMKYIGGIVEKGTGNKLIGNIPIRLQLLGYVKSVEIGVERDKNRGPVNFIWKTIQSGMLRTILPVSKYNINSKQKEKQKSSRTKSR